MRSFSALLCLLSSVSFTSLVTAQELVFYNWEDYIAPAAISQFEAESGHTIKVLIYDRDNERDTVLASGRAEGIDLVIIDSVSTRLFGKNALLYSQQKTFPDFKDSIQSQWRDSCGNYGVPYLWGTLGIVYRKDIVIPAPSSWSEILSPRAQHRQHLSIHLDSNDTLAPALKILGLSINTEKTDDLKAAYKLLLEQKKHVTTYNYIISYNANPENAEKIHLALAYSGDQQVLNNAESGDNWGYVVPKEGTSIWLDCLAVLSSSKHKKAAAEFIAFINRPKIAALNAEYLWVATPNIGAFEYLGAEFLDDETVFPSQKTLDKSELNRQLSSMSVKQRNRIIHQLDNQ